MSNYPRFARKVVGETWIEKDVVKKSRTTKNTERQLIERTRTRAILLECGHAVGVTRFKKVPTTSTFCPECERPGAEAYYAKVNAEYRAEKIDKAQAMPVDSLGLQWPADRVLSDAGFATVGELIALSSEQFMERCGITKGDVYYAISMALASKGMSFGMVSKVEAP